MAPAVGGVRFGPALAAALYGLLAGSLALSLWTRPLSERAPSELTRAAPWVFLAFALGFAAYRLSLVRMGKYPAAKAFFQIGAALVFFALLLPHPRPGLRAPDSLEALLRDSDPRVRALAAEVARYRPDPRRYAATLVAALRDADERVRIEAHRSLVRIAGQDLGDPNNPEGLKAWGAQFP